MAVESTTRKKARSGNPATRAQATPPEPEPQQPGTPTRATDWVSREGRGDTEAVLLPSGNTALVRRTGPEAFLEQGLIPDSVTPIIDEAVRSKKGLKPRTKQDLLNDPAAIGSMVEMLDRTLCYAVVEPKVIMPPGCVTCGELNSAKEIRHKDTKHVDYHEFIETPRDADVLYADRVDLDDKMFVMNFCLGGTRDLQKFRHEYGASVAGVLAGASESSEAV